jgi:hypothetical protein
LCVLELDEIAREETSLAVELALPPVADVADDGDNIPHLLIHTYVLSCSIYP